MTRGSKRTFAGWIVSGFVVLLGFYVQAAGTSTRDGVYTSQQAKLGEVLYQDHCVNCHGAMLEGDVAPALVGQQFHSKWDGRSVRDLFDKIRTQMPPDGLASLPPKEVAAVVAYILSADKMPAGNADLPTDTAVLQSIRLQGP